MISGTVNARFWPAAPRGRDGSLPRLSQFTSRWSRPQTNGSNLAGPAPGPGERVTRGLSAFRFMRRWLLDTARHRKVDRYTCARSAERGDRGAPEIAGTRRLE